MSGWRDRLRPLLRGLARVLHRDESCGLHRDESRGLHRDERGFSLAEELISLMVLAFAVGLVIAGIYTATEGVKVKHGQVNAGSLARSQLELVVDGSYRPDPTAVPYPTVAPVTGMTVDLEVEYWTAPNGPFTSTVRNDGMQKLTVTVSDGGGQIVQLEGFKVDR